MMLQAHTVVLSLPAKLCAQRAADRIGHEGNVEGEEAKQVVGMMSGRFRKDGVPGRQEGLASIIVRPCLFLNQAEWHVRKHACMPGQ